MITVERTYCHDHPQLRDIAKTGLCGPCWQAAADRGAFLNVFKAQSRAGIPQAKRSSLVRESPPEIDSRDGLTSLTGCLIRLGWSTKLVAELLGVTPSTIADWARGRRKPHLSRAAAEFKCDLLRREIRNLNPYWGSKHGKKAA